MKKKLIIIGLIILIILGALYLYKIISKNDVTVDDQVLSIKDVKIVELGKKKNGEEVYQGELFKSYEDYKKFMEDYDSELVLKEKDFE